MESLLEKMFEHAPALGVMALIVWMFIKHIDKTNANFISTIRSLNTENITAREESKRVIEENTRETAKASVAMEQMTNALNDFLNHQKHQRVRT